MLLLMSRLVDRGEWQILFGDRVIDLSTDRMVDFSCCQDHRPVDRWKGRFVCV